MILDKKAEHLLYLTAQIETNLGRGTGFFFDFSKKQDRSLPFLVTNKHVIKDAAFIRLLLHTEDDYYEVANIFQNGCGYAHNTAILHPDEEVDLAVIPLIHVLQEIREKGEELDCTMLNLADLPTESFEDSLPPMEDIIMIGYPVGLWDQQHNFPIFRRGYTATHPYYDYNGKKEFLIYCACYQGSSGSPVFSVREVELQREDAPYREGHLYTLLGIVFATVKQEVDAQTNNESGEKIGTTRIQTEVNLGSVIKAKRLAEMQDWIYETYYNTVPGYLKD
ncbi:serine protease [Bacillus sp. DX1.1]|uniref:S1 family peptidase n=1 Tax=unclassified Bacillus (in: firmicutes) TaxID=185979 RepID=UPI0025708532|nr:MULTISPECIES: serine protease [unclassified Bacillus (in: firmicutes)]MDM5155200.1 serine protease [Bacillus sp. DX1.1]WJE79521.1 serine protease [Bacillus sp. DX3.1]